MGAAVLANAEAGVGEGQLHVCIGVGHGVSDLLICAAGAEHGKGADKGDVA